MQKKKIILGVAPTKRSFLSMEEAVRQKERFMAVIRNTLSDSVEIVDIDDISENGICWNMDETRRIIEKFRTAGIGRSDCVRISSACADMGSER